jgi:hypothetical protein
MTNAEIVQAAFRALESENAQNMASCLADDFMWHGNLPHDLSKANFLNLAITLKRAFPDFSFGLKIVKEVSPSVIKATMEPVGTHTGEFILPGLTPIAPTGTVVALPRQVLLFTLKGEKIVRLEIEVASGGGLEDLLAHLGVEVSEEWLASLFRGEKPA